MANKNFEDYGFKPSAVIAGLNRWYEAKDERALIWFSDPDARPNHYFYDHDKAIDDAIKYLRSMDIFYQPGLKWDDVKYNISTEACIAEFGYPDIRSAWPKVNPCFVGPRTERENEIRDYILKRADMNGIKIPITFRTGAVEDLIAYLFALLVQERKNKELAEKIQDQYRERADGYLEKIDRLQKELDDWNCWYNDKEHAVIIRRKNHEYI